MKLWCPTCDKYFFGAEIFTSCLPCFYCDNQVIEVYENLEDLKKHEKKPKGVNAAELTAHTYYEDMEKKLEEIRDKVPEWTGKKKEKKLKLSLVPKALSEGAARAFMYGEEKHGRWSWKQGYDWSELVNSSLRHLTAWMEKEDLDAESGLNHLDHLAANVAMLLEHVKNNLGKDDR